MGEFVSDRAATTDPVPGSERGHPPSESSSSLQPIRRIGDPPWANVGIDAGVGPDDYLCMMIEPAALTLSATTDLQLPPVTDIGRDEDLALIEKQVVAAEQAVEESRYDDAVALLGAVRSHPVSIQISRCARSLPAPGRGCTAASSTRR